MGEYFDKLYKIDSLFRSLVNSRLRDLGDIGEGDECPRFDGLTLDDELDILREYAVTLFREQRTLKKLFVDNLQVSGKSVGLKDPSRSKGL